QHRPQQRLAAHGRTLRASGWSQPRTLAVCLVRSNRLAWNKYTLSPIMSNNDLGSAQVYTTDAWGDFLTLYNGKSYPGSYLDTGSSVLVFLFSLTPCRYGERTGG